MTERSLYSADTAKGWMPWGILVPFLIVFFVVLTGLGPEIAMEKAGLLGADDNPNGLVSFILFLTIPFGLLGLAVLGWIRFVERRSFASAGLVADRSLRRFLMGHLTGVGMASAIVAGIWLAGGFQAGAIAPAFQSPMALAAIAALCASFVLQSSVEEFVFRGWALSAIPPKFGIVLAVILSSAAFLLLHSGRGAAPLVYLNTGLFALFACVWAIRRGQVWGVMGWHSGWNWILAVGFESRVTGIEAHVPALFLQMRSIGPDMLTGGTDGPEGSIACAAVLIAGILRLAIRPVSSNSR
jgi:hypothetical protein